MAQATDSVFPSLPAAGQGVFGPTPLVRRRVFIFEMRDGKIAKETDYWPQSFETPEWRAQWVERMEP